MLASCCYTGGFIRPGYLSEHMCVHFWEVTAMCCPAGQCGGPFCSSFGSHEEPRSILCRHGDGAGNCFVPLSSFSFDCLNAACLFRY